MTEKPDLNSASREQISSINGIGESLASRIVNYRAEHGSFTTFDDLRKISGFGDSVIQTLKETTSIAPVGKQETKDTDGMINLNSASVEELTSINGVSHSLAVRIVEYRQQFGRINTFDDIKKISGIGDFTLNTLKEKTRI
jgi:competence ComEA-like helix-hairpin-helix protein